MSELPGDQIPDDVSQRFLDRASAVDLRTREALWYALQDMPVALQLDVLEAACFDKVGEASWLVRRAMGSVIANLPDHSRRREELILSLLTQDSSWMQKAIGIVAARRDVKHDDNMQDEIIQILRSESLIDLVWLAHLYGSEFSPNRALDAVLKTGLVRSSWGLLDIFKRHQSRFASNPEQLVDRLRGAAVDQRDLAGVRLHLVISGLDDRLLSDIPIDRKVAESPVVLALSRKQPRGRLYHSKGKWLLSYLYGDWRDQIAESVVQVLDEVPGSQRLD
ncbi:hypothetical protein ACFWF3_36530, partial [Nocardia sp. NPDC060220]|uniref:hypothetical protein n=1 Tax=Nocardia sp. NPDC060220 TaxID=3347076 RepID=UPI00365F3EF2